VKRVHRLRRPDQFQRVRRTGHTWNHHLLRLTVAPNRRAHTRCGFVVSKRIGKAVLRNRARRRVREAVRLVLPQIENGADLVFVVRTPEVAEVPFGHLQAVIRQLLKRAGIWRAATSGSAPRGTAREQPAGSQRPARTHTKHRKHTDHTDHTDHTTEHTPNQQDRG
jgi:ribonuclease P protein component